MSVETQNRVSLTPAARSKGIQLQTFVARRFRGAILDALRGLDWVSRGARRRSRPIRQQEERLAQELGKTPHPQ